MKKNQKKKVYVTVLDGMIAIAAKAKLSKEQFRIASNNREGVRSMLDGVNVRLWFIDNNKPPYNLGIRKFITDDTTSEAIAKEEGRVKEILDQLIEQIDKFPGQSEEKTEDAQVASADDHEEFFKSLGKEVEDSLKKHFGEDVEYALFAHSGNHMCIDSTIQPLEIIHMMAFATAHQK